MTKTVIEEILTKVNHHTLESGQKLYCPLCRSKSAKFIANSKFLGTNESVGYLYRCEKCNIDFIIFDNEEKKQNDTI